MAEETIISWNATNWITIVLMAAIGFVLLCVAAQVTNNIRSKTVGATGTQ